MSEDPERRRFARQFLLGPPTPRAPAGLDGSLAWGASSEVRLHPWLRAEHATAAGRELLCLGHILDPAAPSLGNADVVKSLCDRSTSFREFEEASASLGGRWAALLSIGGEARLYPDAAGMRSIFHARLADGAIVAASQPRLLALGYGLRFSEELDHRFHAHRHFANSWPGELTPYPGVRQLLPNHFLDLVSGEVRRFWPIAAAPEIELGAAAERIAAQLSGFVAATLARGSAALAMTGGYDSRTLFAAAGPARSKLKPFRVTDRSYPWYDTAIPRRLAKRFGTTLLELAPQRDAVLQAIMRENVARMWSDPGDYILDTFAALGTDFVLFGWLSEIARCFYYRDGHHPARMDGAALARAAHYLEHPMAVAEFERWRAGVPAAAGPAVLDLLYWEHRAGNWASLLATACDTFCDSIAAYNCRALLQTALAVPVSARQAPHDLHRRICAHALPGTLDIPFNFSWRDAVRERAIGMLPWRVREWLRTR